MPSAMLILRAVVSATNYQENFALCPDYVSRVWQRTPAMIKFVRPYKTRR